jgi:hypothetical protein
MERALTLDDVRRAFAARDSDLADRIVALADQPDPQPGAPSTPPVREGAPTLAAFTAEVRSYAFARKKAEERAHYRVEAMKALEAPGAEVPLPERARVHEIILQLWRSGPDGGHPQTPGGAYERDVLMAVLERAPVKWGAWRAMKRIFKEAEAKGDWEVLGVLTARFDAAFASGAPAVNEITKKTLAYLVRRAWRCLRRQAEQLPAAYPDAAVLVLSAYGDGTRWPGTWVANHVFHHEAKRHTRRRFKLERRPPQSLTQYRAYPELWRRTPRPLFTLLTRARSEQARAFAVAALKADFRASLREVEPPWVVRLIGVPSQSAHELVVWLLGNVPRFEQGAFRELGLHGPVLTLFDSPSSEARAYAAAYARAHARDLALDDLVRLANNDNEEVRKLARDLLHDRDPRKDVGLDGWGRLLGTPHAHELATAALRKHFGARELTAVWFRDRLLSDKKAVFDFAADLLGKLHTPKALGAAFFADLLDDARLTAHAARYAVDALSRFTPADIGVDALRRALVHPLTRAGVTAWIQEDRVPAKDLGVDFLKALAFEPTWDGDPWVQALKKSDRLWARDLAFSEPLSELSLKLLADVRKISPGDLGFDWLMRLAGRSEKRYGDFAVEYMIKAFVPADFAPKEEATPAPVAATTAAPTAVDLKGQSFLFTGKLATMQRAEAEGKVSAANGKNAGTVNAKLDYLVIGDEGSPLYGAGRKGSKQLAAEKLAGQGAPLKIISETAFLQMLAGEQRTFSADKTGAGCDTLWAMATEPGPVDAPLRTFALRYLRRHHNDISLQLTDRPVDPGAEIPADYLTFERVKALLADPRQEIRAFALELARWELARWKPPIEGIVALCESPHADVRAFVAGALLAGDEKEHARYRVDPKTLTASAVYRFCESLDAGTRALGMKLIGQNPGLALPEEIFRLAESPDRQVRAFVVKTFWSAFRARGITMTWKPAPPPASTVGKKPDAKKAVEEAKAPRGGPPPRPEKRPASDEALRDFLRRALFTVPPGRLPKGSMGPVVEPPLGGQKPAKIRPLPARKAKLLLLETLRDLAVEDGAFARVIVPLLREFMASRGASERAACLVAITRIGIAHPELKGAA